MVEWRSPSRVALLTNSVIGLAGTPGRTVVRKAAWPARGVASAVTHAVSTGPPLAPSTVLRWAASGPDPTKASPIWVTNPSTGRTVLTPAARRPGA